MLMVTGWMSLGYKSNENRIMCLWNGAMGCWWLPFSGFRFAEDDDNGYNVMSVLLCQL